MTEKPYDALEHRRCRSCGAWHNPNGEPIGLCVLGPGTAFLLMQMQNNALLRPGQPPSVQPAVQSTAIPKSADDGCLQWRARPEEVH